MAKGNALYWSLLKRLAEFVKPYRKLLIITITLIVLLSVVSVIRPMLLSMAIDNDILEGKDKKQLIFLCALVGVFIVTEAIMQYFQTRSSGRLGLNVTRELRNKTFHHVLGLKLSYYDQHPIGMMVTRVVSDIDTINDIFTEGLLIIFSDLLKLFTVLGFMFYINWELTLYVLIPIPILFIATNIFKNVTRKSFQDVRTQVARINTFVQEHITGMSLVQLFNRQESEYNKFKAINKEHRDAHIRGIMAYSVFFPVVDILAAFSLGFLLWLGAKHSLEDRFSLGELIAFIMYISLLYRPIRQLADRFNTLQMGMVGCERVFTLLDTVSKIEQTGTIQPDEKTISISFSSLEFAYHENSPVLNNISFEVAHGSTTAIVGPTGSGKTSIISLLARLYEYQQGEIFINGISIREIDEKWLRKNMVFVLQEVNLFSDTLYNNLTLYRSEISKESILNSAKQLGIENLLKQFENGLDFKLSERGNNLSSGQKQLISILRAYIHNPPLLIFDEATSSVDSETEHQIQQAIIELTKNRTCIIIAHRLSTISHADQIIVINKGKISEKGSPEELLKKNGEYARLHQSAFI